MTPSLIALEPVWTLWPPLPLIQKNPSLPGIEPWFPNSPEPIAHSLSQLYIEYKDLKTDLPMIQWIWLHYEYVRGQDLQLLSSLWKRLKKKITSSPAVFYWAMKSYHRSNEKQSHQLYIESGTKVSQHLMFYNLPLVSIASCTTWQMFSATWCTSFHSPYYKRQSSLYIYKWNDPFNSTIQNIQH
jgi:hypothetical protein